jgi:hypothetical protein
MPTRDIDDDTHKYMPDLKTILRTADPKVAAATRRKALDAPEVAEAIAELREDSEVTQPIGVGAAAASAASASPWSTMAGTGAGAAGIDKAALPSALAPMAAPPVVRDAGESTPAGSQQERKRKKGLPLWMTGGAAVLAVAVPVTLTVLLLGRSGQQGGVTVASAAVGTGMMSSGAVGTGVSTAPAVTQVPNVPSAPNVPSVERGVPVPVPSVSAVAPPAGVPAVRPKGGKQGGEPHEAVAPKPAKTVEAVVPPPVPTQQPAALPSPGKSPVEGDRVFGN